MLAIVLFSLAITGSVSDGACQPSNVGTFGELAVGGFFLLSGYLIVQSWQRTPCLTTFAEEARTAYLPRLYCCHAHMRFRDWPSGRISLCLFFSVRPISIPKRNVSVKFSGCISGFCRSALSCRKWFNVDNSLRVSMLFVRSSTGYAGHRKLTKTMADYFSLCSCCMSYPRH